MYCTAKLKASCKNFQFYNAKLLLVELFLRKYGIDNGFVDCISLRKLQPYVHQECNKKEYNTKKEIKVEHKKTYHEKYRRC